MDRTQDSDSWGVGSIPAGCISPFYMEDNMKDMQDIQDSKHNMDNEMINHFHPKVAFISTEKYGHYLSKAIVNVLKKVGARVYSTSEQGSMCHHCKTETHKGYTKSTPL